MFTSQKPHVYDLEITEKQTTGNRQNKVSLKIENTKPYLNK